MTWHDDGFLYLNGITAGVGATRAHGGPADISGRSGRPVAVPQQNGLLAGSLPVMLELRPLLKDRREPSSFQQHLTVEAKDPKTEEELWAMVGYPHEFRDDWKASLQRLASGEERYLGGHPHIPSNDLVVSDPVPRTRRGRSIRFRLWQRYSLVGKGLRVQPSSDSPYELRVMPEGDWPRSSGGFVQTTVIVRGQWSAMVSACGLKSKPGHAVCTLSADYALAPDAGVKGTPDKMSYVLDRVGRRSGGCLTMRPGKSLYQRYTALLSYEDFRNRGKRMATLGLGFGGTAIDFAHHYKANVAMDMQIEGGCHHVA